MAVARMFNKLLFRTRRFFFYPYLIIDSLFILKIWFVCPLCTSIAHCVSLFQASPAQLWVSWLKCELSGHQLDEPMGFSGGLGQQSLMLYFV